MRLIREALLDLVAPALAVELLFLAVQQVVRRPGLNTAMSGGLVPVTMHKSPWLAGMITVLLALWVSARAIGGARGALWGAVAMAAARRAMVGCRGPGAVHPRRGQRCLNPPDPNWGFALGYLTVVIPIVLTCGILLQHDAPFGRHSD